MGLVYLVLLLAALVAMNWRFLGFDRLWRRARARLGRPCRWRRDPTRGAIKPTRFVCAVCGVEAYSAEGAPPRVCRRNERGAGS